MEVDESELYATYMNKLFRHSFKEGACGDWKCPHCHRGKLIFDPQSFWQYETAHSTKLRAEDLWEPDMIELRYVCWFSCSSCDGKTNSSGHGCHVSLYHYDDFTGESFTEDYCEFVPFFFDPPLSLITIPSTCIDEISSPIRSSFSVAWLDFGAAGNKLRIAVEKLVEYRLSELNLPILSSPGKYISLSTKINLLKDKDIELHQELTALRWLGNDASHETIIAEQDLFFSYEILEKILARIFSNSTYTDKDFIDRINVKKGGLLKRKVKK